MKRGLMKILACPMCKSPLSSLIATEEKENEIITGVITCSKCGRKYPIRDSVPELMPDKLQDWYLTEGSPEFYDDHWDKWRPRTQRHAKNPYAYKVKMARNCKGLVLDAGCGYGSLCRFIKNRNSVFLDFGLVGLKKRWIGGNRHRVRGSVENMPFRNEVFNSVLAADVIEHTDSPKRFAREANRILKKTGLFTFSFPYSDSSSCHKFKRITNSMVYEWIDPPFKKYKLVPAEFPLQARGIVYAVKN